MSSNAQTPEAVALNLFEKIADTEQKSFGYTSLEGYTQADREWILDTYKECIKAVKHGRD